MRAHDRGVIVTEEFCCDREFYVAMEFHLEERIGVATEFFRCNRDWPRIGTSVTTELFMSRQRVGQGHNFPVSIDCFMSRQCFG